MNPLSFTLYMSYTYISLSLINSSSNLPSYFLAIEMSTLAFIALSFTPTFSDKKEVMLKYIIVQTMASILILPTSTLSCSSALNTLPLTSFCLLMKSAFMPLHLWMTAIISYFSWAQIMFLLTLQKLPPLMMLIYLPTSPLLTLIAMLNMIFSPLNMNNEHNLPKFIMFSAMNNSALLLLISTFSDDSSILYMYMYMLSTLLIIFSITSSNMKKTFFPLNTQKMWYFSLMLLFLTGMPPFLPFFMKMILMQSMTYLNDLASSLLYLLSTPLTLMAYFNMSASSLMSKPSSLNPQIKLNLTHFHSYLTLNLFNFTGLTLILSQSWN